METLFSRYRNLTVLLIVVLAQLIGVAYQVKTNRDDRLIRVWAVTAVTPVSGIVEAVRRNTIGFLQDYFILLDVREQNRKLKSNNDRLRMENVYFRNQLATAENARALTLFESKLPSRTIAARVIGNSTVATAKAVFIDRGSTSGLAKGMAVVTPEGVVGKVTAVYPLVSQVLLVTDPTFKVGVESQKGRVHGVLNCGTGTCTVEQVQNEDKLDVGEWFFTSGEDRIFPKGFPVGTAVSVQPGQGMKDVKLNLSGSPGGMEEVLVVLEGVHRAIPDAPVVELASAAAKILPPPPAEPGAEGQTAAKPETEADKIRQKYDALGKQQNHIYGAYQSNLPDFNLKAPTATAAPAQTLPSKPAASLPAPAPADEDGVPVTEKPQVPKPAVPLPRPAPAVAPPSILGSRPGYRPPAGSPTPQPKLIPPQDRPAPTLLGAPRRKSTATATKTATQP